MLLPLLQLSSLRPMAEFNRLALGLGALPVSGFLVFLRCFRLVGVFLKCFFVVWVFGVASGVGLRVIGISEIPESSDLGLEAHVWLSVSGLVGVIWTFQGRSLLSA